MVDHLSDSQIKRYRHRSAAPKEVSAILDHIELCDMCRIALSGPDDLIRGYDAFQEFLSADDPDDLAAYDHYHPPAWKVSAYVNDHLDEEDREVIDVHLRQCAQCADETQMLRLLLPRKSKDSFGDEVAPPAQPLPLAVSPSAPSRQYGIYLALAASWAAILLLCVSILFLRKQVVDLRAAHSNIDEIKSSLIAQTEGMSKLQAQMQSLEPPGHNAPESPAPIVLALNDGTEPVTLDGHGALSGLPSLSTQYEKLVRETLISKRLEIPSSVRGLIGKRETLMGEADNADSFSLRSPLGTVVRDLRPTFRWDPLSGATSYTVTIVESKSLNEAAVSPALMETHWTPPRPLTRGKTYIWEVTAAKNEHEIVSPRPPAPSAQFKILDPKKFDEVSDAENKYRNSHLVLGIVYAQAGLLDLARRELVALEQANPNSDVAQRLVRGLPPSSPN